MKFFSVIFLCFLFKNSFSQEYRIFEKQAVYIVYAFTDFKGIGICFSINAYINTEAFGINYWTSFDYIDDSNNFKKTCMVYRDFYKNNVVGQCKKIDRMYCDCFNPIFDSSSSQNYPIEVYSVSNIPIYVFDITKTKRKIIFNKDGSKTKYAIFKVVASGMIINDRGGKCIHASTPIDSYFIGSENKPIPYILFSDIKNCTQLNEKEIKQFGLKKNKIDKFLFGYSNH